MAPTRRKFLQQTITAAGSLYVVDAFGDGRFHRGRIIRQTAHGKKLAAQWGARYPEA